MPSLLHRLGSLLAVGFLFFPAWAFGAPALRSWTVDGATREALIASPISREPAGTPVVFVFHGHGGTMQHAMRTMPIHTHWRDALVVFPQGLLTPGRLTDPSGEKSGWQREAGDQGDRDLHFVDAILATLRSEYRIDERRIFATGHSNGGSFTYLLWAERSGVFDGFAPSAAVIARGAARLVPRPVFHLGSPRDPLVKWAWQSRMIDHVLTVNACGPRRPDAPGCVDYAPNTSSGARVSVFIHDGGHAYPTEAPDLIARFFRGLPLN